MALFRCLADEWRLLIAVVLYRRLSFNNYSVIAALRKKTMRRTESAAY
jgi:hypothetical protein